MTLGMSQNPLLRVIEHLKPDLVANKATSRIEFQASGPCRASGKHYLVAAFLRAASCAWAMSAVRHLDGAYEMQRLISAK
jgi:hypothetical protein